MSSGSQSNRSYGTDFPLRGQASKKESLSWRDRFFFDRTKADRSFASSLSLAEPETSSSRIDIVDGLPPA